MGRPRPRRAAGRRRRRRRVLSSCCYPSARRGPDVKARRRPPYAGAARQHRTGRITPGRGVMAAIDAGQGARGPWEGPARDFVGYGRRTPPVRWPGDASLVVNIVLNYEPGAEYSLPDGDGRNDSWGEYSYQVGPQVRALGTETHFESGSRAGIWRLARLFDRYQGPVTISSSRPPLQHNPALPHPLTD